MSLCLALAVLLLTALLQVAPANLQEPRFVTTLRTVVSFAACGIGFFCGLVALCGLRRAARGSLARAIAGMAIHVVLLVVLSFSYVRERRQAQAAQKRIAAAQEANRRFVQDARRAIDEGKPVTLDPKHLDRIRQNLEEAATHLSGSQQLAAKANAAVLGQLPPLVQAYDAAVTALDQNDPYDFESLTNRQVLQTRRELVQRYGRSSEQFRKFYVEMEDLFRAELARQGASSNVMEPVVRDLQSVLRGKKEMVVQMRDQDLIRAKALLELCDLLESRWGAWRFNRTDNVIDFEADADRERYATITGLADKALERQAELQKQFFKIMK
jgi:hypothetical protein